MKKSITSFSPRAAMMLLTTLLLTLTAHTAWAQENPFDVYRQNGGKGDLTITTSGEYDADGHIYGDLIINTSGEVILNVGDLTLDSDDDSNNYDRDILLENGTLTLNVSNEKRIEAQTINATHLYMDGGRIDAQSIDATDLTMTDGSITCSGDITFESGEISNGRIDAHTINATDLTMTGGSITCSDAITFESGEISNGRIDAHTINATDLTMTDGSITCSGDITFESGEISNGRIDAHTINATTLTMTGGIIGPETLNASTLDMSGGIVNAGEINAKGGTISGGRITATVQFVAGDAGESNLLTISGGTIDSEFFRICNLEIDALTGAPSITADSYDFDGDLSITGFVTDGTNVYDGNDDESVESLKEYLKANGGTTLTKAEVYSVVFNANAEDYKGTMSEQIFMVGERKALSECTFTREGYMFDGWAESLDGSVKYADEEEVEDLTTSGETKILYAHWTQGRIFQTGTYNVDADTDIPGTIIVVGDVTLNVSAALTFGEIRPEGECSLTLNVSEGGSITSTYGIDADEFNMTGGTVNSSSLSADAGEISGGTLDITNVFITHDNIISGGNITVGNYLQINGDLQFKAEHANMSIYAKEYDFNIGSLTIIGSRGFSDGMTVYNPGTIANNNISSLNEKTLRPAYTVSYDANGGTGSVASQTKCSGIDLTLASAGFTRTGYTLDGWATSANGDKVYELGGTYSANADLLPLYAHWTANTYSVRFNKNSDDASGSMDNQSFTYDEAAKALTANDFTRTGYTFVGWATTANGAVAYTDGQSVQNLTAEANVTIDLYAKWIKNIPYIDADGKEQTCTDYTLLRTDNPGNLTFSNLPGGWYVVENWNTDNNDNSGADFYGAGLTFQGDTHLILCDEAEMSVNSLRSIGTLTIYGQSGSSGAINIYNESTGINASKDLTINGGIISVSSDIGYPINCGGNVVINGGRVTATTSGQGADAIFGLIGVVINGGKVTATAPDGWAIDGLNNAINGGTVITNGPVGTVTIAEQMIDLSGTNKRIITESIDGDVATAMQTLFGNESVNASFSRTFKKDVASTICLPFPMTSIPSGKVYEFVGVEYDDTDGWVATMSDATPSGNSVDETVANKPYLFMPSTNGAVPFTGTINPASITAGTTSSTDTYWTFLGTYSQLTYGSGQFTDPVFGFAANGGSNGVVAGEFVRADDGAFIPAFRAFLKYSGSDDTFKARGTRSGKTVVPEYITVRLIGKNGDVDAIGEISLSTGEVTFDPNAWYDLNGRKLAEKPTQRGIYINGNKKVVLH